MRRESSSIPYRPDWIPRCRSGNCRSETQNSFDFERPVGAKRDAYELFECRHPAGDIDGEAVTLRSLVSCTTTRRSVLYGRRPENDRAIHRIALAVTLRATAASRKESCCQGLAGHSICLDYFGSPSAEEAQQGLSQHGEAPSARWVAGQPRVTPREAALNMRARASTWRGSSSTGRSTICGDEPVVYFRETVTNLAKSDHPFHWTQHVTLGPPFHQRRTA